MLKLRINPLALQDLKDIKEYISVWLDNPKVAKRLVEKIIKRYESLKEYPFAGIDLSSKIEVKTDFRYLVCDKYIIFYKVDIKFISIYRILYGARDYMQILFE